MTNEIFKVIPDKNATTVTDDDPMEVERGIGVLQELFPTEMICEVLKYLPLSSYTRYLSTSHHHNDTYKSDFNKSVIQRLAYSLTPKEKKEYKNHTKAFNAEYNRSMEPNASEYDKNKDETESQYQERKQHELNTGINQLNERYVRQIAIKYREILNHYPKKYHAVIKSLLDKDDESINENISVFTEFLYDGFIKTYTVENKSITSMFAYMIFSKSTQMIKALMEQTTFNQNLKVIFKQRYARHEHGSFLALFFKYADLKIIQAWVKHKKFQAYIIPILGEHVEENKTGLHLLVENANVEVIKYFLETLCLLKDNILKTFADRNGQMRDSPLHTVFKKRGAEIIAYFLDYLETNRVFTKETFLGDEQRTYAESGGPNTVPFHVTPFDVLIKSIGHNVAENDVASLQNLSKAYKWSKKEKLGVHMDSEKFVKYMEQFLTWCELDAFNFLLFHATAEQVTLCFKHEKLGAYLRGLFDRRENAFEIFNLLF